MKTICELSELDTIVTDSRFDDESMAAIEETGTQIIRA